MEGRLLKGKPLAEEIKKELIKRIEVLKEKRLVPCLVAIEIGDNPESQSYIKQQKNACEKLGVVYKVKRFPEDVKEHILLEAIEELNNDSKITGVIIQMPLPSHINAKILHRKLSPLKDVEGVHPDNIGMLLDKETRIVTPTALACFKLLKSTGVDLKGKEAVVVGHSKIVGKPLSLLLLQSETNAPTVTVCHIATKDLHFHTNRADVLIVAAGKAGLVTSDMIKKGAIVIDVGTNEIPVLNDKGEAVRDKDGKPKMRLVGDVEFEKVKDICYYITPVPGGVGPLTVIMLIENVVKCAEMLQKEAQWEL